MMMRGGAVMGEERSLPREPVAPPGPAPAVPRTPPGAPAEPAEAPPTEGDKEENPAATASRSRARPGPTRYAPPPAAKPSMPPVTRRVRPKAKPKGR
jgi:hypothetical protein